MKNFLTYHRLSTSLFRFSLKFSDVYVVVNFFLFQLIFIFPLLLGMIMYANEFETKGKQKFTEMKI